MASEHERRNHLYRLRRNRGLRQKHVATLLGYRATGMISRFETGAALPRLPEALLLEMALGARLSEIYVNLHQGLRALILKRATRLPGDLGARLRRRLLRED